MRLKKWCLFLFKKKLPKLSAVECSCTAKSVSPAEGTGGTAEGTGGLAQREVQLESVKSGMLYM